MSFSVIYTRARLGIHAPEVIVETHLSNGLPSFAIVGLPEAAVKESKDRVRSALINAGFTFPSKRIIINLAPGDLPKHGTRFDLPIAIGILVASGQLIIDDIDQYEFIGELALSGEIRAVQGVLPATLAATQAKRKCFIPADNKEEASLANAASVYACDDIQALVAHFTRETSICPCPPYDIPDPIDTLEKDLKDVKGQQHAKRALEIAAAGQHNLLFYGPPGTGKTMLASRLPGILPPLQEQEALDVLSIKSCSRSLSADSLSAHFYQRPFRAPHHTVSGVALVGGGSHPRPGEISLAHHGVLFLDELTEYSRHVLDVLREPLESGEIMISRASQQVTYPARFQLIAAMNPCPCGYHGDPNNDCQCSPDQIKRYRNRLSGPFLDRIDIHVEVPALPKGVLSSLSGETQTTEPSAEVRERVLVARDRQMQRQGKTNANLTQQEIETYCKLNEQDQQTLDRAMDKLNFSARAYHRILKLARTLADIHASESIQSNHLFEAINLRGLDRQVM